MSGEHGSFDVKGIEQGNHVGGEILHSIPGARLVGVPMPALGHRDGSDR
jgi:hypothetical protein